MPPKRKSGTKENVPPKREKKQAEDSSKLSEAHKAEEVAVSTVVDIVPSNVDDTVKVVKTETFPPERDVQAKDPSQSISDHKTEMTNSVPAEDKIPSKADDTATTETDAKLSDELLKSFDKRPPGKLLIAGIVTWDTTGKRPASSETKIRPNLHNFNRFTTDTYRSAVTGCCSAHSVLITLDRKALAFGRNQHGQLGQPEFRTFEEPTPVGGLKGVNVIQAACGRNHTLFLTDTGAVYACGDNRSGQCGIGNTKPTISKATRLKYAGPPIVKVACGADFSMILDIDGDLHSFGLPEYGQLGHNTDGKYFITANRLAFHHETSPRKIVTYLEKTTGGHTLPIEGVKILDFACGNNHTVAIDSKNRAFCWGFGGYGRLGHAEQKDEFVPRLNRLFESQRQKVMRVFCGASCSLAITDVGRFYMFGRNKQTGGECNMYPKMVQDLTGWNITSVGAGFTSILISAEDQLIAWGPSPTYGELGLGDVVKSSSVPKIVPGMEGMKIPHVSMGYSHSLLLVDVEHEFTKQKYEQLAEFILD